MSEARLAVGRLARSLHFATDGNLRKFERAAWALLDLGDAELVAALYALNEAIRAGHPRAELLSLAGPAEFKVWSFQQPVFEEPKRKKSRRWQEAVVTLGGAVGAETEGVAPLMPGRTPGRPATVETEVVPS